MMLKMDKKGVELSINTLVIAILVILVLIVIVIFFLGGAKRVTDTIGGIFFKTTAGTDKSLAVQTCNIYCDQAISLPESLRKGSSYCTSWFNIDLDGNGEAEFVDSQDKSKGYQKYYCFKTDNKLDVPCFDRGTGTQLAC